MAMKSESAQRPQQHCQHRDAYRVGSRLGVRQGGGARSIQRFSLLEAFFATSTLAAALGMEWRAGLAQ